MDAQGAAEGSGAKVRMVCRDCGSEEVTRDAWAAWDRSGQQWVLSTVFGHAFCHECMNDTKTEEVPC